MRKSLYTHLPCFFILNIEILRCRFHELQVLHHAAFAAFLADSKWDATLESMVPEKPMVCWLLFIDQQVNSQLESHAWKVELDMKDLYNKEVVKKMIYTNFTRQSSLDSSSPSIVGTRSAVVKGDDDRTVVGNDEDCCRGGAPRTMYSEVIF